MTNGKSSEVWEREGLIAKGNQKYQKAIFFPSSDAEQNSSGGQSSSFGASTAIKS